MKNTKTKIAAGVVGVGVLAAAFGGGGETPAPEPEAPAVQEFEARVEEQAEELERERAEREARAEEFKAQAEEFEAQAEERKAAKEAEKQAEEQAKEEAKASIEVISPVPAALTDWMLASDPGVARTGLATAAQDAETGLYVIAMEVISDGDPEVLVMGRESLEDGPARQWVVTGDSDTLPNVPRGSKDADAMKLVTSDAYEVAYEALTGE